MMTNLLLPKDLELSMKVQIFETYLNLTFNFLLDGKTWPKMLLKEVCKHMVSL